MPDIWFRGDGHHLALVDEERDYQRGMLLWLLTTTRRVEIAQARPDELSDDVWNIPVARTKNSVEHMFLSARYLNDRGKGDVHHHYEADHLGR